MSSRESNWPGIVFGLTLASFAAYQQFKMPPALPLMLSAYGYDRTLAGAFMSIYAAAGLVLSLGLGRWMERRGTADAVLGALALMAVGIALTLALPEAGAVVLAARGLEGVAFAVFAIAGPVLANRHASPHHLPLVVALTAAWIPIGQLTATLPAQPMFALFGWQALWWLGLVLTGALLAWTWSLRRRGRVRFEPDAGATNPAGAAAESASARDATPGQRLSLALAAAVFMLWSGQYFAYMTWLPQYFVEALGFSMAGALYGYTLPVAVLLVAIPITGRLLQRGVPIGRLLVVGLALQALTWGLIPFAGGGGLGIASLVLYGIGAGIVPACLFGMPSAIAGHGRAAASAFGIIMTGRNMGILAGPIVLAQAFALTGGWDWAAPILGAATVAALALGLWLAARLTGAGYGTSR